MVRTFSENGYVRFYDDEERLIAEYRPGGCLDLLNEEGDPLVTVYRAEDANAVLAHPPLVLALKAAYDKGFNHGKECGKAALQHNMRSLLGF